MDWKISFEKAAEKQFDKLSRETQAQITKYLYQRVAVQPDPRILGKALTGQLQGHWRYRVGDYRIICQIRDKELLILVIEVSHRREVYR
jgi:mRNA interferase RelE/StbE